MNNKINLSLLATKLTNNKWLMDTKTYMNLVEVVSSFMANPSVVMQEPEGILDFNAAGNEVEDGETVAIIPVNGILIKGASPAEEELMGLCNTDSISAALTHAVEDPRVMGIVLIFNSPGGETTGIEELGRKILEVDKIKPVFGWTETVSCSAAYWLMSQCRKLGMTPSSSIGNVGVYSIIETVEKQLELMGIKVEAISSGKYKLLGASFKKMTEEERAILQEDVNKQHEKFKNTVRLKRQVDDKYMEGLAYEGEDALKGNLVDMVVDQFEDFLTTQDMKAIKIDSMKIQGEQTNKEMSLAKDVVPGVPVDSQETPIKTEEPEKIEEEAEEMEECPHCAGKGKIGKCKEKIEGAESEEDKKMESETEKVEESIKEEPAKDEPVKEEKKNKKAEMPDVSEWNSHFGIKKSSNLFYNAALAAVKEAINPKN